MSATIQNCHRNIMGTLSFDGCFPGMRKAQDFIVYPMQDSGEVVKVQSDTRIGLIDLATGLVRMSKPRKGGAYFVHLTAGYALDSFTLATEDVQTLRQWIKSTGGVEVGASIVKSDNTGAIAL